jgi:hypothetical protein
MAAGGWWVQAAMSGGAVLLLGWLGMRVCRGPALRQQVGAWAVRGAVLAAALSALPQWVLLPKPGWVPTPEPVAEATPDPLPPPAKEDEPELLPSPPVAERPAPDFDPADWVWVRQEPAPQQYEGPPPAEEPVAEEEVPISVAVRPANGPDAAPPASGDTWDWWAVVPLLLAAYFAAVGWFALPLLRERLALWWLLRKSAPLTGRARWVFDRLTDDQPRPRAVVSDLIRTPLCAGFFRPVLVLPRVMAERADATVLRWVLAHELCHLRRGDTRTAHWLAAARAVFFFVPWFWAVRKELSLCQEFLADAAASADTDGPAADYAAFLVDLSDGPNARLSLAARMRAGKSDLFRRVNMLLTAKREIAREAPRGFTVVAGVLALGAAVGLSGLGFAADPKPADVVKEKPKVVVVEEVVVEEPGDAAGPAGADLKRLQAELDRLRKALEVEGPGLPDRAEVEVLKKKLEVLDRRLKDGDLARPLPRVRELPADVVEEVKVRGAKDVLKRVPALPARPLDRPTTEILPRDNRQLVPVVERLRLQPPADVVRPRGGAVALPAENDLRKQYEEQLKQFEDSIKKAGDGEAREQLEKARDEYKKAMEEPLKKADAARKELDDARKKLDQAERANRFQNDEALRRLIEKQKEMEERLLKQFGKGLELPFNPEDLKRFEVPFDAEALKKFEMQFGDGFFVPGGVRRNAAQPRLGVMLEKVSPVLAEQLDLPKDGGLVVADVVPGSAAEKAGLKKNDVLLKVGDADVPADPEAFGALVGKLKAGEKVDAVVVRKGKKVAVKGIELPEARKPAAGGGAANESIQVQVNDDDVTLTATVDKTPYKITGKVENGKVAPAKITIGEGKEAKSYESLDKVPQAQRDTVVRLIGKIRVVGK